MFRDLKYLLAYTTPVFAWLGFEFGGIYSFGAAYWAFILIPLLELMVPASAKNESDNFYANRKYGWFFDLLLYSNVVIVYYLLWIYLVKVSGPLTTLEQVGMTFNIGTILGSLGINVAHELGHRDNKYEHVMAWSLLLPSSYLHFFIEHNRGHHKHIGTHRDPSTARKGESIYAFWLRSLTQTYRHAWQLEYQRLGGFKPLQNMMVYFTVAQILYFCVILWLFSWQVMLFAMVAALIGAVLLECVNYIEHYGLLRKKISDKRYEAVQAQHSWNSNHEIGRIVLYELVRHSDHHMKSQRKYQNLRSMDNSPQLPSGYPGMILLALLPFLWYRVMDKRVISLPQNG